MSQNIIFCYSGSGNCLDIAKTIAKDLGDTDIVLMRKAPVLTDTKGAKRVGFVFPCYGGGLPDDVEQFVRSIKVDLCAYTFGVCSYAAYPGVGLSIINSIIPLDYRAGISQQCSCIWLFPHRMMMPPVTPEKAEIRATHLARIVAADVFRLVRSDKKVPYNRINAAESKAFLTLASKKVKDFRVSDRCILCGQCVKLCPKENIRIVGGKPVFGTNCSQCLSCLQFCPKGAISAGKLTEKRERYHNPNVTAQELMESIIHID